MSATCRLLIPGECAAKTYDAVGCQTEGYCIYPKYLGGDPKGHTVKLDAAYHQYITNAFREEWPYGKKGEPLSPEKVQEIMDKVYKKYPLPPGE